MNITRIDNQPKFRGKLSFDADGPKRTYGETVDAKDIKKIYCRNPGGRFTSVFFEFLDNDNDNKLTQRNIIIGDYDEKREDIRNRYMRFLQTYSIALQAPDDTTVYYYA